MILAEPGIATGDCRIEWGDGGAERSAQRSKPAIAALGGRYWRPADQARYAERTNR